IRWESELSINEERSVAATFSRQFDKLNSESRDVGNLLKVLSFLDPENIPLEMVVNGAKEWLRLQDEGSQSQSAIPPIASRSHPNVSHDPSPPRFNAMLHKVRKTKWKPWQSHKEDLTEHQVDHSTEAPSVSMEFHSLITLITSPIDLQTALQKLQSLSLIERQSDDGTPSLWMHDLIELMMQDASRKEETHRDWLQSSVSLVCGTFGLIKSVELPEAWVECEKFIPHLRSLDKTWDNAYGVNLELSRANVRVARYMECRGRYDEAEALLQRTLSSCERHLGEGHLDTLQSMNDLAVVYWRQGRFDDAAVLHQRVLAGREKHYGADDPVTLDSINNLALVYESQRRYDEAVTLFQRALAGYGKRLRVNHPDTLTSIDNLARVYGSQRRYERAEALFRQALVGREKHLSTDHPDTLTSVHNLAHVYWMQGRYEKAEALYQRAIAGNEKHLGADHPETLTSVHNLALVYESQGRYKETEALFQRALIGREQHLGPDHPYTLRSRRDLASLYESQGRHDEAELLRARVPAGKGKGRDVTQK